MTTLTLSPEQTQAMAEIDAIVAARRGIMARLKAAEATTTDKALLRRIKRAKVDISRKNLVTVNARNSIRRRSSLVPVLAGLADLRAEAQRADQTLKDIARILGQAADIVNIIGRVAGLFR